MTTINILIPVHLPDWWKDLAVGRYAKHACVGTRVVGVMPSSDNPVPSPADLPAVLSSKANALSRSVRIDAHILDCFGDPSIAELSRALDRPVIGVGYAGLSYAYSQFARFAVITSEQAVVDEIGATARTYGVSGRLQAVEAVGIAAGDIPGRAEEALAALKAGAERLPNGIDGIVLGCTELAEFAALLEQALSGRSRVPIRVVNPIAVAIRWTEMHLAVCSASSGVL